MLGKRAWPWILILSNVVLVYFLWRAEFSEPRQFIKKYPYLSPRIFASIQNDILINFIPLRQQLRNYVGSTQDEMGLYFEYLPSGVSIGINDHFKVNLASLLKVPLVMAVYKQLDNGEFRKNDLLTVQGKHIDKRFGNVWMKGPGAKISVQEAVRLALTESDNTVSNLLLDALSKHALDEVADYLDIPKEKMGRFLVISPKNYSSVLRSLYLSAYLTKASSNEILDILTQTKLNDYLPAGINPGVKVAHKVGTYTLEEGHLAFSDCGIVYVPERPYILCMMTSANEENAKRYMKDISSKIYQYVVTASRAPVLPQPGNGP